MYKDTVQFQCSLMLDYVAGFYGVTSWFWSHIGKSHHLYFRAQAWENALCIKKQRTHTIIVCQEQKITDRHSGCPWNFNFIINFHIYKGHSGTFMETAATPGMSLRRILFGWQEHLDAAVWQDVTATLATGGEPPESWNLGALACEKSYPGGFLQMTQRNPKASAERIKLYNFTYLARDTQSSNRSKWSKNFWLRHKK